MSLDLWPSVIMGSSMSTWSWEKPGCRKFPNTGNPPQGDIFSEQAVADRSDGESCCSSLDWNWPLNTSESQGHSLWPRMIFNFTQWREFTQHLKNIINETIQPAVHQQVPSSLLWPTQHRKHWGLLPMALIWAGASGIQGKLITGKEALERRHWQQKPRMCPSPEAQHSSLANSLCFLTTYASMWASFFPCDPEQW